MLIDWFTIIAQAVNFLILVWLMKKFLYKPILNAIEDREKNIATELANAGKQKTKAQKEADEFRRKNEEFDQERAQLLEKAMKEADAENQRLQDNAQTEAEALSLKRKEALKTDLDKLSHKIHHRTQEEVLAITQKVLLELSGVKLEDRMIEVFTHRLKSLTANVKEELVKTFQSSTSTILIRSAFDLDSKKQSSLQKTINIFFSSNIKIKFEIVPDLISGIELSVGGQKVAWSIKNYLSSLQKNINELVETP